MKLVEAYNQSIDRAQTVSNQKQVIKIGAGPLATGVKTNNLWIEIGKKHPGLTFDFIPCACALGDYNEFLSGIGEVFDLVSSVYNNLNSVEDYPLDYGNFLYTDNSASSGFNAEQA